METIEMKALRIKNILNSLEEKIESGNITIREAAIELHKAGWINYIVIARCLFKNASIIVI